MSNILYREIAWTCKWLRTYIPYRLVSTRRPLNEVVRRMYRLKMSENRVFASLWAWLRGR